MVSNDRGIQLSLRTGLLLAAVRGVNGVRPVVVSVVVAHVRPSRAEGAEYGITGFAEEELLQ